MHYPSTFDFPHYVQFKSSTEENQIVGIENNNVHIIVPNSSLSEEELLRISKSNISLYDPHIGFSFWLSINAASEKMKPLRNRRFIQKTLRNKDLGVNDLGPSWTKASQLYLPGCFGRPSEQDVDAIWSEIASSPEGNISSLSILASKNFSPITKVVDILRGAGLKLHIEYYNDLGEYFQKSHADTFDLIQTNNDFSALDISDSLLVAFNKNRLLVFAGDDYESFIYQLSLVTLEEREKTHKIIEKIGLDLLANGYIFPIAYYNLYFYVHQALDISEWSNLYPDLKLWKVKF